MSWLAKLFSRLPPGNETGICVSGADYWILTRQGNMDFWGFLRNLHVLFPGGSILYVEGTSIAPDVRAFLEARQIDSPTRVKTGTYWPKPKKFHIEVDENSSRDLADLAEHHAEPEICDHIVIYRGQEALLEWRDVPGGTILLGSDVPRDLIDKLCNLLACSAERVTLDQ